MSEILQYLVAFIPTIVALIGEISLINTATTIIRKSIETSEYKEMVKQNKVLIEELREAKKLNKEYLTKIDRIKRGEDEQKN